MGLDSQLDKLRIRRSEGLADAVGRMAKLLTDMPGPTPGRDWALIMSELAKHGVLDLLMELFGFLNSRVVPCSHGTQPLSPPTSGRPNAPLLPEIDMPASTSLVTFAHAKDWAKRLKKATPSFSSLSQAQEAVAKMLGHASWHALSAFYANQESSSPPSPSPASSGKSSSANPFAGTVDFINAKFPGVNAVQLQVLAHEADEIETDAHALADRIIELDREGYFPEVAAQMAIEEMTQTVHAPPGFMMVRVLDANNKAFQVLLDIKDYRSVEGI